MTRLINPAQILNTMKIEINRATKLKMIQEEFQNQFPFLKLEFYSNTHRSGEGSTKKHTLNSNLSVGEVSKLGEGKELSIEKSMKVSQLEEAFFKIFGLNVQVFRKSNNLWLQTTITDNWTLEKQNQNGAEMNIQENILPLRENDDYHEQL